MARDIKQAYIDAYIRQYHAYRKGGRDVEAENVRMILRDRYDHELETGAGRPVAETTALGRPPENAAADVATHSEPDSEPDEEPASEPDQSSEPDTQSVREWAEAQGLEVSKRGPLPQAVVDAYREAHEDA